MKTSFDWLLGLSVSLQIAVNQHVNALKHEAPRLGREGQDAFRAQNVETVALK